MRSPKYVLVAVLACAVVAVPSALVVRQDVTLRYKWTKGETLRYRMTQRTTSTISGVPGSEGGMTVEQTFNQVWKEAVEDVAADGTTTLRATFESIAVDMGMPMGRMAYDTEHPESASDPGAMLKAMFANMIGESFTVAVVAGRRRAARGRPHPAGRQDVRKPSGERGTDARLASPGDE